MVFLREVLLQGICCREKTGLLFSVDVFSCKLTGYFLVIFMSLMLLRKEQLGPRFGDGGV